MHAASRPAAASRPRGWRHEPAAAGWRCSAAKGCSVSTVSASVIAGAGRARAPGVRPAAQRAASGVALGCGQRQRDHGGRARMLRHALCAAENTSSVAPALRPRRKPSSEASSRCAGIISCAVSAKIGRQFDAGGEVRRRHIHRLRIGAPAERAIEIVEPCAAEAPRKGVARQRAAGRRSSPGPSARKVSLVSSSHSSSVNRQAARVHRPRERGRPANRCAHAEPPCTRQGDDARRARRGACIAERGAIAELVQPVAMARASRARPPNSRSLPPVSSSRPSGCNDDVAGELVGPAGEFGERRALAFGLRSSAISSRASACAAASFMPQATPWDCAAGIAMDHGQALRWPFDDRHGQRTVERALGQLQRQRG